MVMTERRGMGKHDTGDRRRLEDLVERLEDAENRLDLLDGENGLLVQMIAIKAQVATILELTQMYLPNINNKANKVNFWTVLAALTAIIIPITVALIAGYFALKTALPSGPPSP